MTGVVRVDYIDKHVFSLQYRSTNMQYSRENNYAVKLSAGFLSTKVLGVVFKKVLKFSMQ